MNKILVGFHLMSHALRAWGTDRFWSVIGWWHEEIHRTIPQIEEEKRVAAELERSFVGNSVIQIGDYLRIGTALPSTMLSVSTEPIFQGFSINPP